MSGKISFYKGLYKVKVVTESEGYWTVEALEEFEDCEEGKGITVRKGEQRIVTPDTLFDQKNLLPLVKEHEYELRMEKKLKRMVAEDELKKNGK